MHSYLFFGLAASVFVSPFLNTFNRVKVGIIHSGPSIPVTIHVRAQDKKESGDQWTYFPISYFPRNINTLPGKVRNVIIPIPEETKEYETVQVCVKHTPKVDQSTGLRVQLSYQSCASVPPLDHNRPITGGRILQIPLTLQRENQ
jgi:hypothetical protein